MRVSGRQGVQVRCRLIQGALQNIPLTPPVHWFCKDRASLVPPEDAATLAALYSLESDSLIGNAKEKSLSSCGEKT